MKKVKITDEISEENYTNNFCFRYTLNCVNKNKKEKENLRLYFFPNNNERANVRLKTFPRMLFEMHQQIHSIIHVSLHQHNHLPLTPPRIVAARNLYVFCFLRVNQNKVTRRTNRCRGKNAFCAQ